MEFQRLIAIKKKNVRFDDLNTNSFFCLLTTNKAKIIVVALDATGGSEWVAGGKSLCLNQITSRVLLKNHFFPTIVQALAVGRVERTRPRVTAFAPEANLSLPVCRGQRSEHGKCRSVSKEHVGLCPTCL